MRRLRKRYGLRRRYGHTWVPPVMAREGISPTMLEALLTIAGWPKHNAPAPGASVVYDRAYAALREGDYIVLRQGVIGLDTRARYVLKDKGVAAIAQYRNAMRALTGK